MNQKILIKAIDIAKINVDNGGGPFGAVIVRNNEIIASAGNSVTNNNDPTAHAEILAIRQAAKKLNTWNLEGCELYTSCEPCPMCLGAIYWAHIDKVYFACDHLDARNAGFDDSEIYDEMRKKQADRKLNMSQDLQEKGREVFQKWAEMENKEKY